jgi:hypothetical protein
VGSKFLGDWSHEQIHGECSVAYNAYRSSLDAHYRAYFKANPKLAGSHPQLAASFEQAMPPGMEVLAAKIPSGLRHRHHLSGKSIQALGLGLLGTACSRDPLLPWLEDALSPIPPFSVTNPPTVSFEYELDPFILNERPRVTAIDFFVETKDAVICTEIKWAEQGVGRCSCGAGKPPIADCAGRVLQRIAYWDVAREIFFLPDRTEGQPCPISAGYQAIRNAAAAVALANGRQPVFVLLYDANNPYFRPTNNWPGWPDVLRSTLHTSDINGLLEFRAISWQELLPTLPLSDAEKKWALEKHALGSS